jgi:hypothetical protein
VDEWHFTTLEEARLFYREHGCNEFYIYHNHSQEVVDRFNAAVPRKLQEEWSREQFDEDYDAILRGEGSEPFLFALSRMDNISDRSPLSLAKLLHATRNMRGLVPASEEVLVATIICGDSARGGLIYAAYDSGNRKAAREFADLALEFARYEPKTGREETRCKQVRDHCLSILEELRL